MGERLEPFPEAQERRLPVPRLAAPLRGRDHDTGGTVEEAHALCGNVDDTDWSGYDGWAFEFYNQPDTVKPAYLKAAFRRWLDDGGQQ